MRKKIATKTSFVIVAAFLLLSAVCNIVPVKSFEDNTTELEINLHTVQNNRIRRILIYNVGDVDAVNVSWNLSFKGGIVLLGREYNGLFNTPLYPYPFGFDIWINALPYAVEDYTILGIGKGKLTFSVDADNAEKVEETYDVFLFIYFLFEI